MRKGAVLSFETVLTEIGEDHVGVVTMNRPEQWNTFNTTMALELDEALRAMEADPRVRVVILAGAGKNFCAGIDVSEFPGKTAMEYRAWVEAMERPHLTILGMGKPVIAQVQGAAAANGAGLTASADLAVAADSARFGFTAVNVGLFCLGPAVALQRVMGRKRALELLLFGDLIPAARALDMGLVNFIAPEAELAERTREYARKLAAKSPAALQLGKKAFHVIGDMELHQAMDYMNEAFARLCTTQDAHEGVEAFLGKRPPVWSGR